MPIVNMADKKVQEKTQQQNVDVITRARSFWDKYSKPIIYIGAAIILLGGGYLVYKYMFQLPKEEKANDAVYVIQHDFRDFTNAPDSQKVKLANQVLNGADGKSGALKFISKNQGTDAANLCNYYAGTCYLHLKQFDKAIKYLKDFNGHDATQIKSRAYGMIGDAYSELKKNDDALEYYRKAANVNEKDEYTTSEFLFRAGMFAESIGKKKEAIDLFKKIKNDYPLSDRAASAEKYLAKLGEFGD